MSRRPTIGADNNTWGTVLNDYLQSLCLHIGDYGAKVDGVTDDTAAINAAINAAAVAPQKDVWVPGPCKVGALTLKPSVSLLGPVGQAINSTDGAVLIGTAGTDILTLQSGVDAHMAVRDISFYGGQNQIVYNGPQTTHTAIERCGFTSASAAGIRCLAGAIEEMLVRKCRANNCAYFYKHDHVSSGGFNYLDKSCFADCTAGGGTYNYYIEAALSNSVTWLNPILNTAAKHAFYADGGIRGWTFINANQEGCGQSGKENRTTLSGTVTAGATSATLVSATGWATGDGMTIAGAGANGWDFTILSTAQGGPGVTVSGTTVSWTGGTGTTVTNPIVTNAEYDEFYFNSSIATPDAIQFLGGRLGGNGSGAKIRYSINAVGVQSVLGLYGTSGVGGYPVYDQNFVVETGAGSSIQVRRPNNFGGLERFQSSWLAGHDDTGETTRTQLTSPAGKNIVMGLRDSLGNLTGTIGSFEIRRGDPNRTRMLLLDGSNGRLYLSGSLQAVLTALTYSATIATDASLGNAFTIIATNTTAFTISNPTNPATGQTITYDIKNSSGGVMGAITWGAAFLLAGAFTNPANTKRRTISFYYDGTNWVETNRAAADI